MLEYSLLPMVGCGLIDAIVLVVPQGERRRIQETVGELRYGGMIQAVVAGGPTRQQSVRRGLAAVGPEADVVVCHDAARPFATAGLFARVLAGLSGADGAIPVIPVPDTLKRIRDGLAVETIPRDEVVLTQTPQAFAGSSLQAVHDRAATDGVEATDDAMLLEAAGLRVAVVEGEAGNFKITTSEDLRRAEEILARRTVMAESG
jgi:2-C-methyl-D-erythritol 4-phosphate cytidylyltransferase/2-C-methyl-D-erythritol 2,4-cyclodiphosphate synthase